MLQPDPADRSPLVAGQHRAGLECAAADDRCALSQCEEALLAGGDVRLRGVRPVEPQAGGATGSESARGPVSPASGQGVVGRSPRDGGFSGARRVAARTGGPQARVVLLDRQPQRTVQRRRQHGRVHRVLGQRSGAGDSDSQRGGSGRGLRAERRHRRAAGRRDSAGLAAHQQRPTDRDCPDPDQHERSVPVRGRPAECDGVSRRPSRPGSVVDQPVLQLPQQQPATTIRADDVLYRPRAVPARTDDPLQGHLPGGRSAGGQLPDDPRSQSDRDLPGRQWQRDRTPAAQDQRLRQLQRQRDRPARPADGPHGDPRRWRPGRSHTSLR